MTTIIAVENSNHVLFGCDSQVTSGHQKQSLAQGKIFSNGPYTFGVAGYFRFLQALEHIDLPAPSAGSLYSHMITAVVPTIVEATKGLMANSQYTQFEASSVLVAVKGQVFEIGGDGSVIHADPGVYSIGSGSQFALGSLSHIVGEPNKDDVLRALGAAARHDAGTSGPFWVKHI